MSTSLTSAPAAQLVPALGDFFPPGVIEVAGRSADPAVTIHQAWAALAAMEKILKELTGILRCGDPGRELEAAHAIISIPKTLLGI